jgi:class 3 adenylate cyclase
VPHHVLMARDLPTGTVTFVFTEIEGSTKLLHELGAERYMEALAEHHRLLREIFRRHGGVEVDTQGDAFFYAFADAGEAVTAAEEGREALRPGAIHVRVGIHTGTPHLGPEGYVGQDVHLGARIGAAGHGGQVLLSDSTRAAASLADDVLHDLGEHRLKDFRSGHPDPAARRRALPAAEDDREHEPAAAGELVRGPRTGDRGDRPADP